MGNYFKVFQSYTTHGRHKCYWSLHQPSGHMYHISKGYDTFDECVYYLKETGQEWLDNLTK